MSLELSLRDIPEDDKHFIRELERIGFPGKVGLTEEQSDIDIYFATREGRTKIDCYHNTEGEHIYLCTLSSRQHDIDDYAELLVDFYKKLEATIGHQRIAIRRHNSFDKQKYHAIVKGAMQKLIEYITRSN